MTIPTTGLPASGDTTQLAAPPTQYLQHDESQTRREIERSFTRANARDDAIEEVLLAQVVTEGAITQDNVSDLLTLTIGVPVPLDFPTTLFTVVPARWAQPTNGTLQHTSDVFARLGLLFVFFQINPVANNQTFLVQVLIDEVVVRSLEFQTGNSGLIYPVSISDLIAYPVGATDVRVQITNIGSSQDVTVIDFTIQSADFFSAITLSFDQPQTTTTAGVPVSPISFLREIAQGLAALLPLGNPGLVDQHRHAITAGPSLGALAAGYAQQRGSGSITIASVNTFVALDPATTLGLNSSAWLQPANAELSINSDTVRVVTLNLVMLLDTNAANQMFEFQFLIDGVPQGDPYEIPLQGNRSQKHTLGIILEVPVGLSTISLEVRNITSSQDLDVADYSMSVTDNLADG